MATGRPRPKETQETTPRTGRWRRGRRAKAGTRSNSVITSGGSAKQGMGNTAREMAVSFNAWERKRVREGER